MPSDSHIAARFADISQLIDDAKTWAQYDPHLGAHLAGYICVLLTGAIEDSVERMVSLRMASNPDPEVSRFVINTIDNTFRNPDWGAIKGLLGRFSEDYGLAWSTKFPNAQRLHESLQSIVTNKNTLAHTGSMNLHLTLLDIERYYNEVIPAIDELEEIIVGHATNLNQHSA